jgi:hypothetical protein
MSKQTKKLIAIPLWVQITASLIFATFIYLHLRYPHLLIDNTVVALLILLLVVWVFPYVKSFTLPGGAGATFRETVEDAEKSLAKANLPVGLKGPLLEQEQRSTSEQDPNLVLAGMRIEIEKLLKEIGKHQSLLFPRGFGIARMIAALRQRGALDSELASALSDLVSLANQAVHGAQIQPDVARRAIDVGETIITALQDKVDLHKMANNQWSDQPR